MKPKITIAIACYNAEYTIERAVKSAVSQDWPNIEIAIVDDCSNDKSIDILSALSKQDERLKLFCHDKNLGIGAARNTLLEKANGEYIAFFDDDDESLPNRLSEQYQRITNYEKETGTDLVLSFTARKQIGVNGAITYEPTLGMDKTPGAFGNAVSDLILIGRPISGERGSCATCSKMAKRSVLQRVGGYDAMLRRGEDTEFNLRFALLGGHFAGISAPLVTQHKTYTKDKTFAEERKNFFYLLEKHRGYLDKNSWYDFSLAWFSMKFDLLDGHYLLFLDGFLKLLLRYPSRLYKKLSWSFPNLSQYLRTMGKHEFNLYD